MPPKSADPPSGPSSQDPVPRGLRITRDLLERYGLTKGCPKCEAIRRDDDSNTVHHNRACRQRVELEMAKDADQSKKLKEIEERQNKYVARRIEEQDVGNTGLSPSSGAIEGGARVRCSGDRGFGSPPRGGLHLGRRGGGFNPAAHN